MNLYQELNNVDFSNELLTHNVIHIPYADNINLKKVIEICICRLQNESFDYSIGLDFDLIIHNTNNWQTLFDLLDFTHKKTNFRIFLNFNDLLINRSIILEYIEKYQMDVTVFINQEYNNFENNFETLKQYFINHISKLQYIISPDVSNFQYGKFILRQILSKKPDTFIINYCKTLEKLSVLEILSVLYAQESKNIIIDLLRF